MSRRLLTTSQTTGRVIIHITGPWNKTPDRGFVARRLSCSVWACVKCGPNLRTRSALYQFVGMLNTVQYCGYEFITILPQCSRVLVDMEKNCFTADFLETMWKIRLLLASLFTLGSVVASAPRESLDNKVRSTEVADTTTWPFRILYVKASLWTLHLCCRDSNCNCCSNEVTLVLQLWPASVV